MAVSGRGSPFGLQRAIIQLTGSTGRSYGTAGSTAANGTTSHAYVLDYPKTGGLSNPDRTKIDFQGGNRWMGSYQFGIAALDAFELVAQDFDSTLTALVTGSSADATSNTEWIIFSENLNKADLPQVSLMLQYQFQSSATATFGQNYWITTVIPRCQIQPKPASAEYQAAGSYSYQVVPTMSSVMPNGVAFGTNQGWYDNKAPAFHVLSDNPLAMTIHIANASSASIVVQYTPVTSAVGTSSASKNWVAVNGTASVANTVTTATKTVAISAGLTAGDYVAVLYETTYAS
jgi:hypothetical protein